jgi:hypothetical protein
MVELSKESKSLFGKACLEACEVGVVVPSLLKNNLEKAGYKVVVTKMKVLTKVEIFGPKDDKTVLAFGMSHDAADALLQAIYAELKTE